MHQGATARAGMKSKAGPLLQVGSPAAPGYWVAAAPARGD
jgi:hypothetical protein